MKQRRLCALALCLLLLLSLTGCGETAAPAESVSAPAAESTPVPGAESVPAQTAAPEETVSGPEIPGLVWTSSMETYYATRFQVHYYEEGYKYILVDDTTGYLLVPEGKEPPAGLDPAIRVLRQPLDNIYLVSSGVMALFDAMDALDVVILTSLEADGWYLDRVSRAMEQGEILYGGKYSEPDYERLVELDCDLALENTNILHTPKTMEMIELLEIPVFVEYSGLESHPLGRTEWIRLFGALLDREEQADAVFRDRVAVMESVLGEADTGRTVAVFFMDTTGMVQVRTSADYISSVIELAGGTNAFGDVVSDEPGRVNVNITLEQFYAVAMDVDYLVYNASSRSSDVDTLDKLLEKSDLLAECRAVKEGQVYWIGPETYQLSDRLSDLIVDFHRMMTGEEGNMTFLHRME